MSRTLLTEEEKKKRQWVREHTDERLKKHKIAQLAFYYLHKKKLIFESLLRRRGVTKADYAVLIVAQSGKCAICGGEKDNLGIDHDHATGKVRGLLCKNCNVALGLVHDNIETLAKAIEYLSRDKEEP